MIRFLATLAVLTGSLMSVHAAIPAGSLDPEFGIEGRRMFLEQVPAFSYVSDARIQMLQPDGKRLVAGAARTGRGDDYLSLARFLPDGRLDPHFGVDGKVTTDLRRATDLHESSSAKGIGLLPDGKIVVVASMQTYEGYALVRYNADGSLDPTFGKGGVVLRVLPSNMVTPFGLVVYPNGKIVVAGTDPFLTLFAHRANGENDPDFSTVPSDLRFTGFNAFETYESILLQPDGKIVIAGLSQDISVPAHPVRNLGLLRLNSNGSLDTSFKGTGKVTTTPGFNEITKLSGVAQQPDGKLVVAGQTGYQVVLARYLTNGTLDSTLGTTGTVVAKPGNLNTDMASIALQADGKIVLTGLAGQVGGNGSPSRFCLTRFLSNGTIDSTFPGEGLWIPEGPLSAFRAKDVLCDGDQRILLAGNQSVEDSSLLTVCRLTPNGELDTAFDSDGYTHVAFQSQFYSQEFNAVAEQPDGKILIAGDGLCRLLADGTLDTTFGTNGRATTLHKAEAMLLQSDGKIVLAATLVGPGDIVISRYLANGSLDTAFGTDGKSTLDAGSHDVLNELLIQPDGKIIVAGSSGHEFVTIRLLADGSLDPAFGENGIQIESYFLGGANASGAALQADGKILRVGSTYNSNIYKTCLVRLNADGSLDTSFNGSGKVLTALGKDDSMARDVVCQPDGKIVVAGYATAVDSSTDDRNLTVARYLSDGSLDPSFNGTGVRIQALDPDYDAADCVLLQADGKILLTGQRRERIDRPHTDIALVRLTPDGQLDKAFNGDGIHLINIFNYPHNLTRSEDDPGRPILQANGKLLLPFVAASNLDYAYFKDYGLIRILTEARVPKMEVLFDSAPLADGAATLDFGTAHNRTANRLTLQIRNLGEEELRLSQFTFTGTHKGDFRAGSGLTVIAPGTSKEIHLDFSPKGPGTRTAEVALVSNDPLVPGFKIALTGSTASLGFATQPQPQLVLAGGTATFSSALTGEPPVTFEWRKNGKAIRDTNLPTLTLSPVKTSDAGRYWVMVSNDFTDLSSPGTFLGVLTPPPATISLVQGRTLVLNARVAAPAGASISYAWQRGEEDLSDGERISGSKDKTLKITEIGTPESETYTCRVTMTVDGQSATLPHGDTEVTVLEPPSLSAPVFADRYVGEPVSYPVIASNHPSQFTATGLPPGVVINKQTGLISGSPIAAKLVQGENVPYRVTITVSNAAGKDSKSADWKILPLPADLAGSYHGLVAREGSLNRGLGGSFKLSVQPSASFSGQLTLGAKKHAFTGKLEVAGNGTLAEATITIRRGSALADLNLVFSLHPATGGLSGTVSFNGSEESSQITARRSPWSKVEKPDAYVGTYNAALQPQLPPEVLVGIYPEGEGYAILKITATGVATWSGRLADGSAITGSTNLVQGGQVTLHSLSYKNTASVQGWSTLSSPGKNLDGTLDWVKLNIENPGKERTYQEGFPRHSMTVVGGVYTPPPGGELLPALAPTSSNAQITFVCDGALEPFTQSFSLTPGGKVTMPMNDTKLKLQLNAKTGIYNGSFTLTEPDPTSLLEVKPKVTRGASFSGALIQRLGRGAGYSLVPRLPARAGEKTTQTPVFSGSASLTKAVSDN